ncbi:MAG: NAD(P)H-hydrate dehydratase [Woeseiaceae bacterium]|nr:NAD(P)H-hydrate dehydratase [Woeseiaceae bacterium]
MQTLPANLYSVASVREMDRAAIEDQGIAGYTLMTRAATAALTAAQQRFPASRRWQVLCGAGNNGGDGYVLARLAADHGIAVSVLTLVDPQVLKGDAATACREFVDGGGHVSGWAGELDAEADLLIDGILGSGLERDVAGRFAEAVAAINAQAARVVALDIPSGLHGDTGQPLGTAVKADLTVTFVGLKSGLFLNRAPDHCGAIVFDGLGIPDVCRASVDPELCRVDDDLMIRLLARRPRTAHKGDFGHVLVVGGGEGMPGAARLCGEAALRAGAGKVSIATAPAHAATLATTRPELMCHAVSQASDLDALMEQADVIAFGPGLGQSTWSEMLFERVAGDSRPAVWDADALNLLARTREKSPQRIITPHPGEAGVLLGQATAEIQADRLAAVRALQHRYGGVAVLKGAGSLIVGDSATPPYLSTSGNPGMAVAGMGDVLTGIIAGFVAQGMAPLAGAAAGVEAHARAGDRAATGGERGLMATELMDALRGVINP